MALTQCRECGGRVSTDAPTCPHCGCAHPAEASGGAIAQPREPAAGVASAQSEPEVAGGIAAATGALAADEEALHVEAPSLARSIPGSVEAAALIVVAAAGSLAVGVRGPLLLVFCAGGLMCGKPWWRELTFWLLALSLLVALVLFHADFAAALRSPHLHRGLLLYLGSFMFSLGLAALVFPSGSLERSGVRAWTACAVAGLLLFFVVRLGW